MALANATVTLKLKDKLGGTFDPKKTRITATTNADVVIDTAGNEIRLGGGVATINADGTASLTVWIPGAGSNPDSWQTTIHVDYPDRTAPSGRRKESFGPFTITGNADLADLVDEQEIPPTYLTTITELLDGYASSASASAVTAAAAATSAAASAAAAAAGGGSIPVDSDGVPYVTIGA